MLTTASQPASAVPETWTLSVDKPQHRADLATGFITFTEPPESFLSYSIRNFGLTLATLGFYNFWARAEARQRLHRAIRIGGQPLDYSGTGRESFRTFLASTAVTTFVLVAFFVLFRSVGVATVSEVKVDQLQQTVTEFRWHRYLITLPLLFLLGAVVYRKRKEHLRRTWWRGQHFDLVGRPYGYAVQHFWTAFLVPATLGWAAPWRASRLERRKISDMRLGDQRFESVGGVGQLYKAFAALWFGGGIVYVSTMFLIGLTIGDEVLTALSTMSLEPLSRPGVMRSGLTTLAIGLVPLYGFILYYRAAWIEHQISSLVIDGRRLNVRLPKLKFAGLILWNACIKLVSFGAFSPATDASLIRFIVGRITSRPWLGVPTG